MEKRLGGPQSRYGRRGEEKILDLTGTGTPDILGRPARTQSLYRLRYAGSQLGVYFPKEYSLRYMNETVIV
jgi:hypothetical protein